MVLPAHPRRTYGQVSIDHIRQLPDRRLTLASHIFDGFHRECDEYGEMGDWLIVVGRARYTSVSG